MVQTPLPSLPLPLPECRSLTCTETFNYWEPTHFLMFGYGMQTWEYRSVWNGSFGA
jgi:hypothetical protein